MDFCSHTLSGVLYDAVEGNARKGEILTSRCLEEMYSCKLLKVHLAISYLGKDLLYQNSQREEIEQSLEFLFYLIFFIIFETTVLLPRDQMFSSSIYCHLLMDCF